MTTSAMHPYKSRSDAQSSKASANEVEILNKITKWATAICNKNIKEVMSIYAKEIISFDVEAPLQYVGFEAKQKRWHNTFSLYERIFDYEVRDIKITSDIDLAFVHSLNRLQGKLLNGKTSGFWLRWTSCFRKLDENWLIVHEQISAPIDPRNGTACLDLVP